jgi:hypothetical protein
VGGVLEDAGVVRDNYNRHVARLRDAVGHSAERDAIREQWNRPGNSTALSRALADMYRWEQSLAGETHTNRNPGSTSGVMNRVGAIAKYGGRGVAGVGTALSVAEIATAEDQYRATAQAGSSVVFGYAGAQGGAAAGAVFGGMLGGPPGAAVGAVIGMIVGGGSGAAVGHSAGGSAYDNITGR